MKTDRNMRENPSTVFVFIFYYGKHEWKRNNREKERKWDIRAAEMDGNQKI